MRQRRYLASSNRFLWIREWQLSKIYDDFAPAESAHEMLTGVAMKEVKEGYVIMSTQTLKVLGDFTLEDKADVVLMSPVESLLHMVPSRPSATQAQLPFWCFQPHVSLTLFSLRT